MGAMKQLRSPLLWQELMNIIDLRFQGGIHKNYYKYIDLAIVHIRFVTVEWPDQNHL